MICPECNTRNPESATKCVHCGKDLPETDAFDSGPGTFSGMKTTLNVETIESTLKKGAIFAGRYEILNDGFKGGMGIVFKVKDNILNDVKALKVILPSYLDNEKAITRFKQEVATSQKLVHENIVRVYDIGESADKILYFTMEWVEGISLREFINERKKYDKKLTLEEVKYLIGQICSALSYAHKSIIHRDIKPENVLVIDPNSKKPKLQIADFGIAKAESQSIHVSVSAYMGTPIYMAPEQYNDAAHADKRADIYSVGVILYELLTFMLPLGTFPMPSEVHSSLPKEVDDIIKKALNPDKTKRYEDPLDIIRALEDSILQVPKPDEVRKPNKLMIVAIAAGVILLSTVFISYKFLSSKKGLVGQEVFSTPGQENTIPTTESKLKSVKRADISEQTGKNVMDIGIFYEDKKGRLMPLNKGITLYSKDNYAIYFKPKEKSYLYIFQIDSEGKAFKLFPNTEEYKTIDNPLMANRSYWIPAEGKYFFLDESVGKEEIYFFSSNKPIKYLDDIKITSKAVIGDTVKLMGVGGTTESNMKIQVVSKGDTLPFEMLKTKINSDGNLVYNTWFWHK